MIIREVEMRNIRSYEHARIELPEGTILFEGDIGSGKTTILMAIEFALFGNSTPDFYKKLLRKGATEGFVRIRFEVNGQEYEIFRSLVKKGRGIKNEESYVITPQGKRPLSATEIRTYVLRLMGLNVSAAKRKSLPIVTYAIYTPQETMKSILEGRDEDRLEVIRKVFRLDEYRIARDNADIVTRNIDSEMKVSQTLEEELRRIDEEIENLKEEKAEKEEEIRSLHTNLGEREKIYGEKSKILEELESRKKRYMELQRGIERLRASVEHTERRIRERKKELEQILEAEKEMKGIEKDAREYEDIRARGEALRKDLEKLERVEKELARLEEREKRYSEELKKRGEVEERIKEAEKRREELQGRLEEIGNVDEEKEMLEEESKELYARIRALRDRLREKEEEREHIAKLGAVCPTCRRPLSDSEKRELMERSEGEMREIRESIEGLERKLREIERKRREIRGRERRVRSIELELARISSEISSLREKIREIERMEKALEDLRGEKEKIVGEVENLRPLRREYEESTMRLKSLEGTWRRYIALKEKVERRESVEGIIRDLESRLEEEQRKMGEMEGELNSLSFDEEQYENARKECEDLRVEIAKIREALRRVELEVRRIEESIGEKEKRWEEISERIARIARLSEIRNWLDEKFKPALEDIERMRLAAINEEFRMLFEEWFNDLLGEGEYQATIDENFKPIVRYEQYDMPLGTLSGGERTSVALAYRLALNTMVKRALGLKSNLLILDEPTDGFSKDQLYKLKDVLEKMDTDQIIIVSHEKELRNLADVIFVVEKKNGKSRARPLR